VDLDLVSRDVEGLAQGALTQHEALSRDGHVHLARLQHTRHRRVRLQEQVLLGENQLTDLY